MALHIAQNKSGNKFNQLKTSKIFCMRKIVRFFFCMDGTVAKQLVDSNFPVEIQT